MEEVESTNAKCDVAFSKVGDTFLSLKCCSFSLLVSQTLPALFKLPSAGEDSYRLIVLLFVSSDAEVADENAILLTDAKMSSRSSAKSTSSCIISFISSNLDFGFDSRNRRVFSSLLKVM